MSSVFFIGLITPSAGAKLYITIFGLSKSIFAYPSLDITTGETLFFSTELLFGL
jgi:hypothetical protein